MRSLTTTLSAATVEETPESPHLDELQFFTPSRAWNIIIFAQLSLIMFLSTSLLLEYLYPSLTRSLWAS
jgi:hypothetical protein